MKKILNILLVLTILMVPGTVLASGSASGSAPGSVEMETMLRLQLTLIILQLGI